MVLNFRIHIIITNEDIRDALHNLIQFLQFTRREKHSWVCVTFSKVAG